MKGFKKARHLASIEVEKLVEIDSLMGRTLADNLQGALPAIALDGHPALTTAYMNDCEPIICLLNKCMDMVVRMMFYLLFLHQVIAGMCCMQLLQQKQKEWL